MAETSSKLSSSIENLIESQTVHLFNNYWMRLSMMWRIIQTAEEHRFSLQPLVSYDASAVLPIRQLGVGRTGYVSCTWRHGVYWVIYAKRFFPHGQEPSPMKTIDSFFSHSKITSVLLEDADRKVMFKRILRFIFVEKEKLLQPGKLTSMSPTKFSLRQNVCSDLNACN